MNQTITHRPRLWTLAILMFALLVTGCSAQVAAKTTDGNDGAIYTGALDSSYENALDATSQLALGTLSLEGTADAVTEEQAAGLLPLWQVLQGSELQSDAERLAVTKQIELKMTDAQVAAIAAMQLTQADARAWTQNQGTGERGPDSRRMPEGLSGEQLTQMREQFSKQAGVPMPGTSPQGLIRAVVDLLSERVGEQVAYTTPVPTPTTTPTPEPPTEVDALPTAAHTPDLEATVAQTPTGEPTAELEPANTPVPTATPTSMPVATQAASESSSLLAVTPAPALEQVKDTNPGPPFTIEVSANRAAQDPLVEASRIYKITGTVRNDGDQTYAVSDILVTFYDATGFRGTFQPAIRDGKIVGGEWHWHGETEAEFGALLLAPGEEWPFSVAIVGQDMASFLVHPDAAPTERESVPVKVSDVRLVDEGTGYLRISGTATNVSSLKAKNVTISGVLLDANGQIVSIGSVYVLQEDIEPGASVPFDVRIEQEAYASYQLYAQAERDWD
jgi:hypothetical protein